MRTVFIYEWKKLVRQPIQLLSLLIFSLLSLYAMWEGKSMISEQKKAIVSIEENYRTDFEEVLLKLNPIDTTALAKRDAEYAKMPVMINYWLPQNVINKPSSLAFLSIGERDLQPFHYKVKTSVDYMDSSNVGINNPLVLWAGNFDFSFVLIYLLPILIIIFSYDVLSREREMGTHRIISVQGMGTTKVTLYKLWFRFVLIGVLILVLIGIAFLLANELQVSIGLLWICGTLSYQLFWFSLCFLIVSWQWGTLSNLIVLFSGWLLFVMLLPSYTNIHINAEQPVPLRTSVASFKREASEEIWGSDKNSIVETFLLNNPKYRTYYDPDKERDTTSWGEFEIAGYYDLLQRRVETHVAPFEQLLEDRRRTASRLNQWNPVVSIQTLYNSLAQTSMHDFQEFKESVRDFQLEWRDFIYSFQLPEKEMSKEDLLDFPVFKHDKKVPTLNGSFTSLSLLWGWTLLFLLGGIVGYKAQSLKI